MNTNRKRVTFEGFAFGLIAGVILLAALMFDSAVTTGLPADPLRRAASVVLGFHALGSSLGTTYLAGLAVHLALAGFFGVVYAQFEWRLAADARRHYGWQMGIGVVYAALVWIVNVAFLGHWLFPWLVLEYPMRHVVMHALFYGGALGLMFAGAERRTPLHLRPSVG
jgi:hypothetical protein